MVATVSSSESEEENSDNPSTWKLSAYTRQKARRRKPSNRNLNIISISTDDDDDNSLSEEPHSSSYEEDVVGEGESVSESSEAGAVGFLDDEAMEASFSSEMEEMEYEGSGESEVDRQENEDGDERKGFIVDEAEEEKPYRPWTRQTRRRRRRTISSSSNASTESNDVGQSEKGSVEKTEGTNLNFNQKLRKRVKIMESSESSLDDDEIAEKLDNGMVDDHRDTPNVGDNKKLETGMISREGGKVGRETDNTDSEESRQESSDNEVESDKESSVESSSEGSDGTLSSGDGGQEDEEGESGDDEDTPGHVKWKRDLLVKAREAYDFRNKRSTSLRKLVYSDLPLDHNKEKQKARKSEEEENSSFNLGGLFQLAKKKEALSMNHRDDVSLPNRVFTSLSCDWSDARIAPTVKSLFITGNWGDQDAKALLEEDEAMYGDFEDLETGEKHGLEATARNRKSEGAQKEEEEEEREAAEEKRLKKKKQLKAAFDVEYDDKEGGEGGFLEDLKRDVSEQERRNREEFEGLDEQTRIQYEGFRPGTYVRMELKGITQNNS